MEKIRCLIIGGGPAGYTAAIYASRAALNPVLYEGMEPGGQLTTTTVVENFPGFPEGVDANQLMDGMRAQAQRLGADIRRGVVTDADLSSRPFRVTIDGETVLEADTLIIATGATARYLGLPSEQKFRGMGVSACATCDGFFYRKKDVAVVGGGDTACEEATYLANLCRKVYMVVRRDVLRASVAMQERVRNTPNIEILWNCNTQEVLGDESGVNGVRLKDKDGKVFDVKVDGFFWPSGTIRTRTYSRNMSRPTRTGTSSPEARLRRRMSRECSRRVMFRIQGSGRRLPPPRPDAAPRLRLRNSF